MSFWPPFHLGEFLIGPWRDAPDTAAWTVLMGTLVATTCGWMGCYLIFQGLSLVGDAISHTALLGIILAWLLTGAVGGPVVFVCAAIVGLLTAMLIRWLPQGTQIREDAATGVVFTSLFALAIVLISTFAHGAHLDAQHVLLGDIGLLSGDMLRWRGIEIPTTIAHLAGIAGLQILAQQLFRKELLISAFDPSFAATQGLHPNWIQFGLMAGLSIVVVGSFTMVGAILVVSMLITPAATASLLTVRFGRMLLIVPVVGFLSAVLGYHLSVWGNVTTGGSMVVASCLLFVLAMLFSPQSGLVARAIRQAWQRRRTTDENLIRLCWKIRRGVEADGATDASSPESPAPATVSFQAIIDEQRGSRSELLRRVRRLAARNLLCWDPARQAIELTPQGVREALRLDRAHRLWEAYLVNQIGLPADHVHAAAEELEHLLDATVLEDVEDLLGHPERDPHGSIIPRDESPGGEMPLSQLRTGEQAWLTGVSDRPGESAAELTAAVAGLGLTIGGQIRLVDRGETEPSWTIALADGSHRVLTHRLADAVRVRLTPHPQ